MRFRITCPMCPPPGILLDSAVEDMGVATALTIIADHRQTTRHTGLQLHRDEDGHQDQPQARDGEEAV